jgi:hypothetical protein
VLATATGLPVGRANTTATSKVADEGALHPMARRGVRNATEETHGLPRSGLMIPSSGTAPSSAVASVDAVGAVAVDELAAVKSGAPRGYLSNAEARAWYNTEVKRIDISGPPTRETAARVIAARNALKQQARDMMADRAAAEQLAKEQPLQPLEYYVGKYAKQGYTGESLWHRTIQGGVTPNAVVNKKFGVR